MSQATILIPRKVWTKTDILKSYEAPGRKHQQSHGAFVAGDLAELKKAILLCDGCQHKFDWKRHGYYNIHKFEKTFVTGNCDACRVMCVASARLYLHESTVNQAWLTKDEQRRRRRHATVVGG